ncbi:Rieske (2Fe-2S) protein [Myxococcota bacterium]|nr:Rieske (2Fe-2S) protein [Myxococcota bacterium]
MEPGSESTAAALPIPNGWFAVAVGDEIGYGEVVVRHYFDQDLVVFRTASGQVAVFDPYCPHLGAHLGHGGRVEGEGLRCPFHGWRFDTSGACSEVPYAKRVPPNAQAKKWPTLERYGFVFVWRDAEGRPPFFELPEVPESASPDWSTHQRFDWVIRAHGQELGENGVDPAHFRFVHGTLNVPVMDAKEDGPRRVAYQPVEMRTPRGDVKGAIEAHSYGMGFSTTRFTGICETLELATMTPVDARTSHVRYAFTQPRVNGQDPKGGVAAAIIRDIVKQTHEDIPIWENKVYRERPILCEGDGPIAQYRRWCQQFYSGT